MTMRLISIYFQKIDFHFESSAVTCFHKIKKNNVQFDSYVSITTNSALIRKTKA